MGNIPDPWSTERIDIVRSRLAAGKTYADIAVELEVPRNAIAGIVFRKNLRGFDGRKKLVITKPLSQPSQPQPQTVFAQKTRKLRPKQQLLPPVVIAPDLPLVIGKGDPFVLLSGFVAVGFFDLRSWHCRWPLTCDDGQTRYCGRRASDLSYCAEHGQRAFTTQARPKTSSKAALRHARAGSGFSFQTQHNEA